MKRLTIGALQGNRHSPHLLFQARVIFSANFPNVHGCPWVGDAARLSPARRLLSKPECLLPAERRCHFPLSHFVSTNVFSAAPMAVIRQSNVMECRCQLSPQQRTLAAESTTAAKCQEATSSVRIAKHAACSLQSCFQLAKASPDLMLQDIPPTVADTMS